MFARFPEDRRLEILATILKSSTPTAAVSNVGTPPPAPTLLIQALPLEAPRRKILDGDSWNVCSSLQLDVVEFADHPPRAQPESTEFRSHVPVFFDWSSSADPRRVKRTQERYMQLATDALRKRIPLSKELKIKNRNLRVHLRLSFSEDDCCDENTVRNALDRLGEAAGRALDDPREQLGGLEGTDLTWRRRRIHRTLKACIGNISNLLDTFTTSNENPIPRCWGATRSLILVRTLSSYNTGTYYCLVPWTQGEVITVHNDASPF